MSLLDLIKKWYNECKLECPGFNFEPFDGPRIGFARSAEIDPMRLIKTRENYLNNG